MSKIEETTLEIDLKALEHNYHYLRSKTMQNNKFMAVVKAFAYGSDAVEIAHKLETCGVDYFGVAYIKEGIALRKGGIEKPILVFYPQPGNFEELIAHKLIPTLYSRRILTNFIDLAEKLQLKDYPVHLNFNTGMNRLGFEGDDVDWILKQLQKTTSIKVAGIYSHLAASEDEKERNFGVSQVDKFTQITQQIIEKLPYKPLLHLCNTSGILNYPQAHFDMVRSGIGLYGYANSDVIDKALKPVGTLKTIITQIRTIKQGESVGYNRQFFAERPTKIATLPIGHADGINRIYGKGKGYVNIQNKRAPIIGNVCMDIIMVDITDIDCQEGDEVLIFGLQKSAEDLALAVGTISYELITSISQRIRRVIIP